MKRTDPPPYVPGAPPQRSYSNTSSGGGVSASTSTYGDKKHKSDDGPSSFEEDLMMMDGDEMLASQILDGDDDTPESQERRWARPTYAHENDNSRELNFQWMDIDTTAGEPMTSNPDGTHVKGSTSGPVPVIRLYGVTQEGQSIMAVIHGVTPYFYTSFPSAVKATEAIRGNIRASADAKLREKAQGDNRKLTNFVLNVENVSKMQSLVGYHGSATEDFLKVYVAMPNLVPAAKRIFDDGILIPDYGIARCQTFESNVPFVLRFMIDGNISGSDWIQIPGGTYSIRDQSKKISRCTIEIDVFYNNVIPRPCTGLWSSIAPLRILSFDIECQGRKGHFPDALYDPVIQIANTLTLQGSNQPIVRNVFTLNTCLPIVGAQVISSQTEGEMMSKWRAFVLAIDPDVITGYNIGNFDIPYLLNRAKALEKTYPDLKRFPDIGRLKGFKASMKDTTFQSSAYGKRENIETTITGRVIFDMLPYMFRNHKMSSYSLNSVSSEFLGQQKEDVHHSIITDLQNGTDADRRRLAVYCIKDAYLPQLLMNKLSVMVNYIEMARVTGVPLSFLLTRGQQIKVFSMILRKCRKENLLIPNVQKHGQNEDVGYEGATVIEPKRAYYEVPIATLDFASLYPSIMQAYNLCYSTLVSQEKVKDLPPDSYEKSPSGFVFVKATTKKGILPQILDEILAARKRAKKDMASATDPQEKAVQNGRQLALKISANSVYGFTGATVGQLPCVPIASSVTSYGRNLLLETRSFVERTYTVANGYAHNAEVVYGDTDSVMVKFGLNTVGETMPLAEKAAAEVSAIFPKPIKLEFEKVYFPYLLMNKKRYAGLLWTNPDKYDKLDAKGLETVRRDNCLMVRKVVETCLRKIIIERDVKGAIEFAKNTIADLLQNKLDISMLVISKSLGKSADDEDYKNKQAHVELAKRMKQRDAGSAPNVGDRVAYVIIEAAKGVPMYEKSEDPVYVLDNGLSIDTDYYLTQQLQNPLTRIFEPVMPNPQTLFTGDHTRNVVKPKAAVMAGKITMFAVKQEKCLGCKALISASDVKAGGVALCAGCKGKESEIYLANLTKVNDAQQAFNLLWTECQRCQGSFHQDVICSNRDCPIFYKRKKVQIDLLGAQEVLDRFDW